MFNGAMGYAPFGVALYTVFTSVLVVGYCGCIFGGKIPCSGAGKSLRYEKEKENAVKII